MSNAFPYKSRARPHEKIEKINDNFLHFLKFY